MLQFIIMALVYKNFFFVNFLPPLYGSIVRSSELTPKTHDEVPLLAKEEEWGGSFWLRLRCDRPIYIFTKNYFLEIPE